MSWRSNAFWAGSANCSGHVGWFAVAVQILVTTLKMMTGPLRGTQSTSTIVARLCCRTIFSLGWGATAPIAELEMFGVQMVNNRESRL